MDVIYCEEVPEARRASFVAELFGVAFPLRLEPTVFAMAERLSSDYRGGYWRFYALSNGGFFMAPACNGTVLLACENGFVGSMSPEAFGIAVCLYAYSALSFLEGPVAEGCAMHFQLLREYALEHREAQALLTAID